MISFVPAIWKRAGMKVISANRKGGSSDER